MDILVSGAEKLGLVLDHEQQRRFLLYYQEVLEWNSRINLTSVVDWHEFQRRHLLDSLTISLVLPKSTLACGRVLDVGSGAGLPGLPLKIARPNIKLSLLDSTAKKTAFLKHIIKALVLDGVEVYTGRAEELGHNDTLREGFDVVVSRALAPLRVLAEFTLPFCRPGGIVVAPKKGAIEQEVAEAEPSIIALGGCLKEIRKVNLEELNGDGRVLVVLEKKTPTSSRYPRRPGVPQKRPL
ncbi:MAG: 16S rRNA (guanine(527)-N(7))-methyltransferase RsmG [Chloroflexi bacterium]|nr:16S rRNA (guanine(527)-N(7))-methyltransferase RsmG [Chloroflexota bacterium]